MELPPPPPPERASPLLFAAADVGEGSAGVLTASSRGGRGEKWGEEMGKGSGGRWVWRRRNLGCSMSHRGGLQGDKGGGGGEKDRLICACEDRGEQPGGVDHNRMDVNHASGEGETRWLLPAQRLA